MSDEEWDFEHEHVCGFIRHFVDEPIYNLISQETHAGTLWKTLESLYASKSGSKKLYLLKSLVYLLKAQGIYTLIVSIHRLW